MKDKSEKESLVLGSKTNNSKSYGGTDNFERKSKTGPQKDAKKIGLSKLFRYATFRDKVILSIGTVFAFIHGAGMPLLALVFGSMTDTFIQQSLHGFANSTTDTVLPSGTSNGNTTISHNDTSGNLLTREEFNSFMIQYSLYYVYIGLVVFVSSLLQAVCWEWSCERQTYRLRQEFFYQVIRQEIAWFDQHQTGDLSIKLSDDLERVREGIGHKFSMVIQYVLTAVSGFIVGFFTSWQLTLVILSLTPLLAGTSAFTGRLIATQSAREQQKYGKAGAVAEEVLSCIKTVASFGGEEQEISRYENALAEGRKLAIKKYHVMGIGVAIVFFVMYASYAVAFWYGCQLLYEGHLTPGDIFTVFFSVLVGAFSLGNAIPFISIIAIAQGSGAVVFEVIDSEPFIDPYSKEGYVPDKIEGRIQFKHLNFKYPSRPTVQILEDFNLDIEPGKTVAIVGPSGAGKSTIVSLILRFYDPEQGSVLLDGYDVRLLNLAWLRHHIGVVSQEPVLFGTTIFENIRYGREDVTPDEVVAASKMANAHDFISSLPQGYDTLVGERGAQLSGGQKQRIAISRALVRDPRILLLDEATSALDAKSESVVQAALDKARKGRTTIIIAHRLSTVKDADVIYALKDGRIAESGTHAQLMSKEGLYFELVTAQTSMDSGNEFSGNDDFESGDSYSEKDFSIGNPTRFFGGSGVKVRRKVRRKLGNGRAPKNALPDPDRARMTREAEELNAKYPGVVKILKVNKPEWALLLVGGIGCIITGAITPIFAYFYAEMFATFSLSGQDLLDAGFFWAMMFLALAGASAFGFWLRTFGVATAGEYLTMRLRLLSYTGIVRQPIGWFDKECNSSSRLTTRLARDAPIVKAAAGHRLATVVAALVTITAAIGMAFFFGWQLALAIVAGFPILVVAGYIQIQVQKSGQKKDAVLMEDAGRTANEAIANIRTVQSLSQEKIFFEKYLEHLLPVYIEAHKQGIIYGLAFSFSEAVIFMIYSCAFRYGGYLIEVGVMDPTNVFRTFFAISFCAVSVGQMTSFVPDYTKANLAAALIFNLIEQKSKIDPFSPQGVKPQLEGRITFTDVIFRYSTRPDMPVLQGLSFDVQPGQTLALVGPSGCGKSTVVALIERFYDVLDGRVAIDGFDVRSLNIKHLRKHIGVVTQEPVLFDCTIRENIAYGYGDGSSAHVSDDLIIEAAQAANIHNFICSLPAGYDTFVGERGTQLSGGQKQRIAIARALIRDPKILLLDEATSALDTESEKVVQDALDKARAGRTCIIIAHRLSTIQNADLIAVVHKGKIIEIGTHDQLRSRKGMYYKLTKKQQITH